MRLRDSGRGAIGFETGSKSQEERAAEVSSRLDSLQVLEFQ